MVNNALSEALRLNMFGWRYIPHKTDFKHYYIHNPETNEMDIVSYHTWKALRTLNHSKNERPRTS